MEQTIKQQAVKLNIGDKIKFKHDPLFYNVMASSDRWAIVSRKLNRRVDADLLKFEVDMGAYFTFTQAFNACKDLPIYSIIDFEADSRSKGNLLFSDIDYFNTDSCSEGIKMLESGEMGLSRRGLLFLEIEEVKPVTIN